MTENLHASVRDALSLVSGAITDLRRAKEILGDEADISKVFLGVAGIAVELKQASEKFAQAEKDVREALRSTMEAEHCYDIGNETLTLNLVNAPRYVVVTDKAALMAAHPELVTTPEPQIDRKAIGDLLKRGKSLSGCSLSNGGAPVLRVSVKREQS